MKYLVNKFTFLVIFIGFLFYSCESFIDLSGITNLAGTQS